MRILSQINNYLDSLLPTVYNKAVKSFCKITPDSIVFQGKPDYSDNPRALSDYLVRNGYTEKYKVYWVVSNKKRFISQYSNDGVIFIQQRNKFHLLSWNTYKILMTAHYVFSSHGFIYDKNDGLKGQKYITLWHGCGYKDNAGSQLNRFFDLALVPGPLFLKTKAHFWNTTEKYLLAKGYPRYDWILHPSTKAIQVIDKYHQKATKVVIWMPTYRNSIHKGYGENVITQFPLMAGIREWENLDSFCGEQSICLLVKLHMSQRNYDIDFNSFKNIKKITNQDFDIAGIQMYEFLALTDGLISDYSSVAIDYLLVNKPIAFALDDYEIYNKTRGFVFDDPKKYMPGHHLFKFDDLKDYLSDVSNGRDVYKIDRDKVSEVAIYKCSNYCKEIVKELSL